MADVTIGDSWGSDFPQKEQGRGVSLLLCQTDKGANLGVGKVASAQNIASYFVTLAALGLPSYGVREFAKVRDNKAERDKLFTELLLLNIISTTLAVVGFLVLVFINTGFNGEWALYRQRCG